MRASRLPASIFALSLACLAQVSWAQGNEPAPSAAPSSAPSNAPVAPRPTEPPGDEYAARSREPSADPPGITPVDEPVRAVANAPDTRLRISGFYRVRGDLGYNWDLNRGPTPSGIPFYPGAYVDGGISRTQTNLDQRLRVDAEATIGYGVSFFARLHVLDNVRFGSLPDADFAGASTSQRSPPVPIDVRQAYGQVLLPFGVLRAGRMGAPIDWGTGFVVNSGSALDDDFGDVGDRISLTIPLAGLLFSGMYEVSATGPGTESTRSDIRPGFDLDPRDDVRTGAISIAKYDTPTTRRRLLAARRTTFNFGVFAARRTQEVELPTGSSPTMRNVIPRGLTAYVADAWGRLDVGSFTLEAELGMLTLDVANISLDPVFGTVPVTGLQFGGVFRADWRASPRFFARVEVGFASGDSAPGFGARPSSAAPPLAGDLDGPQFDLTRTPADTTIDNFRFHPNYRVDMILFRRILGTVTDAAYLRPMVRYRVAGMLTLEGALIGSIAMDPNSTPSGRQPLGVELNVAAVYEQEHGFVARAEYGVLVPLSGLREETMGIDPQPAHALRLILAYRF